MGAARTRIAALDVGTNTVRLLVADIRSGKALVPHRYDMRITRLGGGATANGLAPDGIARTVAAVADFAAVARADGASALRAVATSAAREAKNRGELVSRLRQAAALELEIVSGAEEAALALSGVRWSLRRLAGGVPARFALLDVGGGSSEVVVAWRDGPAWRSAARSVPIGTVRAAEAYVRGDPPAADELRRLEGAVGAALDAALSGLLAESGGAARLVGTAGTLTTLAAMDLGLAEYDRGRIDGHRLARGTLEAMYERLAAMPAAARLAVPGLPAGREDLIVPGLAIVLYVMRRLGTAELTVVDGGLLEGICLERFGF